MALNNPYDQYKKNMVETKKPAELTLMLYNGALKFIRQACIYIEEKNIEKANNCIIKVQDIIAEFMLSLNMDYEISNNLYSLYDYMAGRLIEANMHKDKEILEEVGVLIEQFRDTWKQAIMINQETSVNG